MLTPCLTLYYAERGNITCTDSINGQFEEQNLVFALFEGLIVLIEVYTVIWLGPFYTDASLVVNAPQLVKKHIYSLKK